MSLHQRTWVGTGKQMSHQTTENDLDTSPCYKPPGTPLTRIALHLIFLAFKILEACETGPIKLLSF